MVNESWSGLSQLGINNDCPGIEMFFCMSGHVNNPGNFEIALGTPFSEITRT